MVRVWLSDSLFSHSIEMFLATIFNSLQIHLHNTIYCEYMLWNVTDSWAFLPLHSHTHYFDRLECSSMLRARIWKNVFVWAKVLVGEKQDRAAARRREQDRAIVAAGKTTQPVKDSNPPGSHTKDDNVLFIKSVRCCFGICHFKWLSLKSDGFWLVDNVFLNHQMEKKVKVIPIISFLCAVLVISVV